MAIGISLNNTTVEMSQMRARTAVGTQRHMGRGVNGLSSAATRGMSHTTHSPVSTVCNTKKVYSSMGTQPKVMPVTRLGSYHQTEVATR